MDCRLSYLRRGRWLLILWQHPSRWVSIRWSPFRWQRVYIINVDVLGLLRRFGGAVFRAPVAVTILPKALKLGDLLRRTPFLLEQALFP